MIEIASADDDTIAEEVLAWSGLGKLWDQHELGEIYDFISDVLEDCPSAWIDQESWDNDLPGHSGVWHTVSTSDPKQLKAEIKSRILELATQEASSHGTADESATVQPTAQPTVQPEGRRKPSARSTDKKKKSPPPAPPTKRKTGEALVARATSVKHLTPWKHVLGILRATRLY
jgi:hypothetical protein